jgi:hypothetical protein
MSAKDKYDGTVHARAAQVRKNPLMSELANAFDGKKVDVV